MCKDIFDIESENDSVTTPFDPKVNLSKDDVPASAAERAKAAKEMRDKKNNMESNYGKVKSDVGMTKKQIHDMLKTRKFVSKDAAENMRQKKRLTKLDG